MKEAVLEVLKQHIDVDSFARGILIDGYPRTMQQVEHYENNVRIIFLYSTQF